MGLLINSWNPRNWRFTKYSNGDSFLSVGNLSPDFKGADNLLKQTMANFALFICLKITADVCAKANFIVEDSAGNEIDDDPIIKLIKKPNYLQEQHDFITQWIWQKITFGSSVMRPILPSGVELLPENVVALFNLNPELIKYPKNFKTPMLYTEEDINNFFQTQVQYKDDNNEISLAIGDLVYFYDVAAGLKGGNQLKSPSRITAVMKSISNIEIAMDSENVMLQTNGREMFSGGQGKGSSGIVMPMKTADRNEITDKLINVYGMSKDKVKSIVTEQGINWQSLHIAIKDLGLHESTTKNAAIIRSAFGIPETVFKLYLEKGDTFENKKEGEVELIQNVGQTHLNDFCRTLNEYFKYTEQGKTFKASFTHLESMQYIEERKKRSFLTFATAVEKLTRAGFSTSQIQQALNESNIEIELEENGEVNQS